jgi:uncharacterized protein YbbK (DUF523 family)
MPRPILVSACLLGIRTRYDGACKRNDRVFAYLQREGLLPVPVCPEQLAGLPTPRPATRFSRGDGEAVLDGTGAVCNAEGALVNELFLRGAAETLKVAQIAGCREAVLKERSPSCGVRQIYLEQTVVAGRGVATALLARHGIQVCSEEDL